MESEIPARHTPAFAIGRDARLVTPNQLVELDAAPEEFAVIGAGKTAMDACGWLLDAGVDPDRITWIRSRDPWLFRRASFQPLQKLGAYMELQASWVEAAAAAESGADFARRLEAAGVFVRIDPAVEPDAYRGPIISDRELEGLRTIERVVRQGRVRSLADGRIELDQGEVATRPGTVHVDCTAAGVPAAPPRPIFAPDRITLQYVTVTGAPFSAATVAVVEATREDDAEKNRLCPPITFSGRAADLLGFAHAGMSGLFARTAESDLAAWTEGCRLNPAAGAAARMGEPQVAAAFTRLVSSFGPAMQNRGRRAGEPAAPAGAAG